MHSIVGSQSNHERLKYLQTSVLNPVLGNILKMIRLFCSNVAASLRRALIDALVDCIKLGFIEGVVSVYLAMPLSYVFFEIF